MVFHILNVFFLDSVNRSLYNDSVSELFRGLLTAFCFLFLFLSSRDVNRNFVLSQNGACGI